MYRLHDSIVKLWIMYEGTEKIKKYEIRLFVTETFELVTYGHTFVTHRHNKPAISQNQNAGGGNLRDYVISHFSRQGSALVTSCLLEF